MWKIMCAPNNASKWQMGFNSAFKGLMKIFSDTIGNRTGDFRGCGLVPQPTAPSRALLVVVLTRINLINANRFVQKERVQEENMKLCFKVFPGAVCALLCSS
jgi:hypothetical protein